MANPSATPPSRASRAGLDWFTFFLADVHAGFGPFLSVYLTQQAWPQADIGLAIAAATLVGLVGQMPGGALVDALRSERGAAGCAMIAIGLAAASVAAFPSFAVVLGVSIGYAAANCVLIPAVAAISLGLVGHADLSERFARNARFSSIGSALTTIVMGAIGYRFSARFVFVVTAVLALPALLALARIRSPEIDPERAHGGRADGAKVRRHGAVRALSTRGFLVLGGGIFLFHFANMPALVLFSGAVATERAGWATVAVAAAIVVSQATIAIVSPWIGREAQTWGRRPLLLGSFAILMLRVAVIGIANDPYVFIALQVLDGICAAIFATVVPLTCADITRGTGHFNLAVGLAGTALSLGASAGLAVSGLVTSRLGSNVAFLALGLAAALAFLLTWCCMPETGGRSEPV